MKKNNNKLDILISSNKYLKDLLFEFSKQNKLHLIEIENYKKKIIEGNESFIQNKINIENIEIIKSNRLNLIKDFEQMISNLPLPLKNYIILKYLN